MNKEITGMMIYYYYVCKRKLWYFYNQLSMEDNSENVAIGKMIDETSYSRDEKHININNIINIDFIRDKNLLHEVKKSNKIEQASIMQVKYYLYYLKKNGVPNLKAQIDYPLLKQNVEVELTEEDEKTLDATCNDIIAICNEDFPPVFEKKKICGKCAYFELCFI